MVIRTWALISIVHAFVFLIPGNAAIAAEIKVLSTPTLKSTLEELGPRFEQTTGHKLHTRFDSVNALKRLIDGGEPFDIAILLPPLIDELSKQGKIAPDTRTDIARANTGVAVRTGVPKPDVSSVDALKKALLSAKSISYSEDSASGRYFIELTDRLGISAEIRSKLKSVSGGAVVDAVAKGDADMTVITMPNIIGVAGVQSAGALPAELQNYTTFTAGASSQTKEAEAAKALLKFLSSPESASVLKAKGMERGTP